MTRTIKLAVAAAVALTATSAFATNGDHLIGMGAKARGMGGVGIGMSHGAESGLSNPALISTVKGTEISFGGTVFMPDVETNLGTGGGSLKSDADLSVIPEVAIAQNLGDGLSWGIGMYGVAGMGTDYRDQLNNFNGSAVFAAAMAAYAEPFPGYTSAQSAQAVVMGALGTGNFGMVTNLQLMQFAVPLAYKTGAFSIGIAPVLQYGSLDINYKMAGFADSNGDFALDTVALISGSTQGVAQDLGFGYNVGAAFSEEGLTVGASYKSAINMNYKGQISQAMADFTQTAASNFSDDLEQPAEIGVGASYAVDGHTLALDYKKIKWADAKGYKEFMWEDQNVYMIGYQYAQDNFALRAGYNHSTSPIKDQGAAGGLVNTLNLLGFPAIVEDHYTVGGSVAISKSTSVDLAYVYVPEVTNTYKSMLGTDITTKHSQDAVSFQLNFGF